MKNINPYSPHAQAEICESAETGGPSPNDPPPFSRGSIKKFKAGGLAVAILLFGLVIVIVFRESDRARGLVKQADALISRGEIEEAANLYQQAYELRPGDIRLLERVAGLGEEIEDFDMAAGALRELMARAPERHIHWSGRLGDLNLRGRKFTEAAECYRDILEHDHDDLNTRRKLANALQWSHQVDEAVAENETILLALPDDPRALYALAKLHCRAKNYDSAHGYFRRYLDAAPVDEEVGFEYAKSLASAGLFEDAARQLKEMLDRNPSSRGAPIFAARLLLLEGRFDEALDAFLDLYNPERPNAEIANSLALTYRALGEHRKAAAFYELISENDPDDPIPPRMLVNSLLAAGEYDRAAEIAMKRLGARPADVDLAVDAARACFWGGRMDRAINVSETTLEVAPDSDGLRSILAKILMRRGDYEEAIPILNELRSDERTDFAIDFDLARAYAVTGYEEDARRLIHRIVGDDAETAIRLIELAGGEYRSAEDAALLYQKLAMFSPIRDAARLRLARTLLELKRHDEAWLIYGELAEIYPDDPALLREAAEAAAWAGKLMESIALRNSRR